MLMISIKEKVNIQEENVVIIFRPDSKTMFEARMEGRDM